MSSLATRPPHFTPPLLLGHHHRHVSPFSFSNSQAVAWLRAFEPAVPPVWDAFTGLPLLSLLSSVLDLGHRGLCCIYSGFPPPGTVHGRCEQRGTNPRVNELRPGG